MSVFDLARHSTGSIDPLVCTYTYISLTMHMNMQEYLKQRTLALTTCSSTTQCMILRGEPERDVRYTHTSQELIQQAEANTHMVFTDAAHHALCRTNGCIQGQLKAVSLQQITHI